MANGYIHTDDYLQKKESDNHDVISILNTNQDEAVIHISIYFTDRDPAGPYDIIIPGKGLNIFSWTG
ncbi:MAG: hypothetical protein HC906_13825 [Bacteroidales bacterium]|nr:hypothetical protein [Bacteroidales bacterium]